MVDPPAALPLKIVIGPIDETPWVQAGEPPASPLRRPKARRDEIIRVCSHEDHAASAARTSRPQLHLLLTRSSAGGMRVRRARGALGGARVERRCDFASDTDLLDDDVVVFGGHKLLDTRVFVSLGEHEPTAIGPNLLICRR